MRASLILLRWDCEHLIRDDLPCRDGNEYCMEAMPGFRGGGGGGMANGGGTGHDLVYGADDTAFATLDVVGST